MSKADMDFVNAQLEPNSTEAGSEGQLEASVLTSADTKLAYNEDEDRFEAVIVGDINAFPEGLLKHSELQDEDITGEVSEALTGDFHGEIVINLPEYAFQGDDGLVTAENIPNPDEDSFSDKLREMGLENEWLIEEKLKIAIGSEYGDPNLSGIPDVEGIENVYLTYGGRGLQSNENGELLYEGQPVEGCVNLSDRGENLLSRIDNPDAFSRIVNAPTAVWNSELEDTQKVSLMEEAGKAQEDFEHVQTVDAQKIEDEDEVYEKVKEKFAQEESLILKTDPIGSWGDGLIVFDYHQFREAAEREFIRGDKAGRSLLPSDNSLGDNIESYVDVMIENESARVSNKSNRENVELVGEDGFYGRGDTDYAVVEHAAEGTTEIDGDTYHIIDDSGEPIDFVPLLVSNGGPEVVSYFARVSEDDENLNVNRGADKFDVESLERFYNENSELFEEVAGREVSLRELEEALDEAGQVAYIARNRTAYNAERRLI
jgi:hypothetical protein